MDILDILMLLLGIAIVTIALVDALWTTLWVDGGAGPISSKMTSWTWRGVLRLVGERRPHRYLSLFGPSILISVVMMWVVMLWLGWVLVFSVSDRSILAPDGETPADLVGRFYFVAYTIFTLGNGDFSPNGGRWQILTNFANASGMLLVTLSVTYLLSVVSAVVRKRAFATQIAGLGTSPETFLCRAWNGSDFRSLDSLLQSFSTEIATMTEQYLAYPILQYYHAARPSNSPAIAISVVDEAITMLTFGVPKEVRPNVAVLHSLRGTLDSYLSSLENTFINAATKTPPAPDLDRLRNEGIPTLSDEEFIEALESSETRRRQLYGMSQNLGWSWLGR